MLNCVSMENNISNYINDKMSELGITQADIARGTGLTTGGVSMLINGTRKPNPETLNTLARYFKEKPEKLYKLAGYLPEDQSNSAIQEIAYKLSLLPDDKISLIEELIDGFLLKNRAAHVAADKKEAYKTKKD